MNEVRPQDDNGDRLTERDSQLSAMFDGELSAAECELLARRLTRDEALRGQWSRFALVGAALRAERGVKLHDRVATRVQAALVQDPTYGDSSAEAGAAAGGRAAGAANGGQAARVTAYERWLRVARPVVGASIAAGVAAVSILWLRTQTPEPGLLASAPASQSIVLTPEAAAPVAIAATQPGPAARAIGESNGEPERIYSTPAPSSQTSIAPPARFANYVVAHSEYSGPLARRMALLGIVGTEAAADDAESGSPGTPAPASGDEGAVDAP